LQQKKKEEEKKVAAELTKHTLLVIGTPLSSKKIKIEVTPTEQRRTTSTPSP